jgi:anthranilate/para-aminobenzoate synthase component I
MSRQLAARADDPALAALADGPADQPVVLLHSGRFHPKWATRSLLARPRAWFRYTADRRSHWNAELEGRRQSTNQRFAVRQAHGPEQGRRALRIPHFTHHLWTDLRTLLDEFPGRWIGYFSYDLCRLIEPGKLAPRESRWPLVELGWCPEVEEFPISDFRFPIDLKAIGNRQSEFGNLTCNFSRGEYESAVRRVLDYIAAGDVFQVNFARTFTGEYRGGRRALFERLARISPAWYGAYLELPGDRAILSTSPELFLRVESGHVTTRPIKGTRPATCDADELRFSAKDAAELNMIVDLMRNDLGRVCSYGSVRVTEPRTIETHPTIHHAVATIEGDLHPSKDIVELLKATLPGGSVTGAPKVRAMQVIDEIEPDARGPYCGAIGILSKDELHLSIAIRTMLLSPRPWAPGRALFSVRFSVGGGIVADSTPAAEYEETTTKAQAMLAALS